MCSSQASHPNAQKRRNIHMSTGTEMLNLVKCSGKKSKIKMNTPFNNFRPYFTSASVTMLHIIQQILCHTKNISTKETQNYMNRHQVTKGIKHKPKEHTSPEEVFK
jgi:hypothetical protein